MAVKSYDFGDNSVVVLVDGVLSVLESSTGTEIAMRS